MQQVIALVLLGVIAVGVLVFVVQRKHNPVREISHEYFNRLWLWPPGSHTRWEAEIDPTISGADATVGFHAETTHEDVNINGPTEKEITFCREWMSNLDGLFMLTKPAIEEAWKDWVKGEMSNDWKDALSLDGFSVPKDGDSGNQWSVTYLCKPAGHYFCIGLRKGKATLESVDG